jgi:L-fuconolactonase
VPDLAGQTLVIDAHQHCWDPAAVDYDWLGPELAPINRAMGFAELAPELDAAGVDYTILVQSADSRADTDYMFRVAALEPRVAAIVGWVPLDHPDVVDVHLDELCGRPGFVGVRSLIHNQADADWLLRPRVQQGLRALAARGLTFDVVAVFPRHLQHVPVLAQRHPELRIVIDHLAKPPCIRNPDQFRQWRAQIVEAARSPLVHAKVSGLYPTHGDPGVWSADELWPAFDVALEAFGVQRLMFGGDWPVSVLAGGYSRVWAALSELFAELSAAERAAILGLTAASFYQIPARRLGQTPGRARTWSTTKDDS